MMVRLETGFYFIFSPNKVVSHFKNYTNRLYSCSIWHTKAATADHHVLKHAAALSSDVDLQAAPPFYFQNQNTHKYLLLK